MPTIERLGVALPHVMHHSRYPAARRRREQQMDMIAHQHIGVDRKSFGLTEVSQQIQVVMTVVVIDVSRPTIDAALGDMQGRPWQFDACSAWHGWQCDSRACQD